MGKGPGAPESGAAGTASVVSSPSWEDRQLVAALRRLASARSQLASLTEAVAAAPAPPPAFDHDALRELEDVHDDLVHARDRARSRFGGHARHRVAELEVRQAELLARLGVSTIVEGRRREAHPPPSPAIDPAVVDFARREVAEASRALADLLALDRSTSAADPDGGDFDGGDLDGGDLDGDDLADLRSVPPAR